MSVGGRVAPPATQGGPPSSGRTRAHVFVALGAAAAVASAVAGRPLAWLLVTVVTLAVPRVGLRGGFERLPSAAVVVVATLCSASLVSGLVGLDVTSSPWPARVLLGALGIVLVVGAQILAVGSPPTAGHSRVELIVSTLPAGVMALLWILIAASPLGTATSWFLSGDHLRHLALVTRTLDAGALEYTSQSYPRGWHAALALLWSSSGLDRDAEGLAALIRLQSLATWLVLVLIALALGLTASTLTRSRDDRPLVTGAAGCLTGALVVGRGFFGDYVPRGFQTSLVALLIVSAVVLRLTRSRSDRGALVVASVGVMLMAHVWQVLLPVVGLLLVLVLRERWRAPLPRRSLVADVVVLLAATALAVPGVLGALHGYGVGAIAVPGDVPPPALGWIVVVALSGAVLAMRTPRGYLTPLVVAVGASVVTALGLMLVSGVGWSSYYPNKTIWTAAALGLPLVCAAASGLLPRSVSGVAGRAVVALVASVVMGLVTLSLAAPVAGVRGAWSAADGDVVIDTVTTPAAADAAVVWAVGSEVDDATSQLLLDFYSATSTTPPLGLAPRGIDEQCRLLEEAGAPLVLSDAVEADVRSRFTCVPQLDIVRVEAAP